MTDIQNPAATTERTAAWDMAAVGEFTGGKADILVLNRNPLNNLDAVIEPARIGDFAAPVSRKSVGFEIRSGLREFRMNSPELAADLEDLATTFLNQFDLQVASFRIEVARSQSCPKFHCDNVNVRLVTTYVGPTTEYQYAGEGIVHSAPLFGLVFLKGHCHPTCGDTVHHRSPEVPPGVKRLCVAIDF